MGRVSLNSILPEPVEAIGSELGVHDRVLDVAVPEMLRHCKAATAREPRMVRRPLDHRM